MPRRMTPHTCACRCGGTTKGGVFLPGHDLKLWSKLINLAGSPEGVRDIVEKHRDRQVKKNV